MAAEKTKKEIDIAEFAFSGVLFSLLGYVMLAAFNLQVKASFLFWVITALPGIVVLGLSLRRCALHWPACRTGWRSWSSRTVLNERNWQGLVGGLGLCALGGLFGLLASRGSLMEQGLFAVGASAIPWWKIQLLHRNFAAGCVAALVGTMLTLLTAGQGMVWIDYAISAWVLFVVATASAMTAALRSTSTAGNRQEPQKKEPAAEPII